MTKDEAINLILDVFASYYGRHDDVTPEEVAERIFVEVIQRAVEDERSDWISLTAAGGQGLHS